MNFLIKNMMDNTIILATIEIDADFWTMNHTWE